MPITQCRHFSGHRPCLKSSSCDEHCGHRDIPSLNIVLVHLGALGAVVRSTSLLAGIHRRYPRCRLFWITDAPADQLLQGHPLLDGVFRTTDSDLLSLAGWEFDLALVVDKSRKAAGVVARLNVDQIFGFKMDPRSGGILPATAAARELWEIGLSNEQKFFVNQKTEARLQHESLELGPYQRDDYDLPLTAMELGESRKRQRNWTKEEGKPVIGMNTGCSSVILAKRWSVDFQRQLLRVIEREFSPNVVLLGGPEDTLRNWQIGEGSSVFQSPTENGLRDGMVSVEACDIVLSGDSLGMHLGIARKKFVIAWFGPTCAHEIDLFERGEKILSRAPCGPCWKRDCEKPVMCYDLVDIEPIKAAMEKGILHWQKNRSSSSKLPSSEICF